MSHAKNIFLSLYSIKKLYNAKMINLIGEDILVYRKKIFKDNEFFFDYHNNIVKKKRKMGHLTIIEK